ncbi:hypothetical protein AA313_de0201600 [Arthrobotrys entomopaga]|nr:hypothetical protein AA313_de0201600 [Arthrobotrys entomopaga]
MRLLQLLVILVHGIATVRASCAANNCVRAVTGTAANKKPDVTSRRNDCSAAQHATQVSSITSTTTTTIYQTITVDTLVLTATTTITIASGTFTYHPPNTVVTVAPKKRNNEVQLVTVPSYATACTNLAQYLSACSCWGITATTTTLTIPIPASTAPTTITITATLTTTTTTTVTSTIPVTTITGCPIGLDQCSDGCKDLRRDPNNCGFCGVTCPDGTCGNGYCSNPSCRDVTRCNNVKNCVGEGGGCTCLEGVSGNFCGNYYASCYDSPKCVVDTDCPADGRCVTPDGTCCGVSICYRVGDRGGSCDNRVGSSRVF